MSEELKACGEPGEIAQCVRPMGHAGSPRPLGWEKVKIAFDVDDTLIVPSVATGFPIDTPNYEVVALYKWFQSQGNYMIIWSGSGVDYAKRWAERLGLHADEFPVKAIRPDVDIAFDDCSSANLGRVTVKVNRTKNSISRKEWNVSKSEPVDHPKTGKRGE